ncbi:hypothetical protein DVH24_037559 [Malus domestica]|uniref:Uncharacterized protein n=1 Tax=Malus domestica TaxID=3750 RepID=A0A498J0N9_MALDO|nr:hypothetical protein DVH24_037559 [Malus domestica]
MLCLPKYPETWVEQVLKRCKNLGLSAHRDSFDEPDYIIIDTLFALAEAYMFAQLVDFKDKNPGKIPEVMLFMYKDVRAAVDLCHRDGTLKQMVAKDPQRYINEVTSIVPMLKMLRDSGRATFLVTNSLWDYTNIVMNFLCESRTVDGSRKCNFDWLKYFDVVITGRSGYLCSAKPSFFHDGNRANLFEVELESGMLINTDNVSLTLFQGGSVGHLHKLLSIESSSQISVICVTSLNNVRVFFLLRCFPKCDHIFPNFLSLWIGWRTMLVVPELEREVELLWELRDTRKVFLKLLVKLLENLHRNAIALIRYDDFSTVEKQKLSFECNALETLQFVLYMLRLYINARNLFPHLGGNHYKSTSLKTAGLTPNTISNHLLEDGK